MAQMMAATRHVDAPPEPQPEPPKPKGVCSKCGKIVGKGIFYHERYCKGLP